MKKYDMKFEPSDHPNPYSAIMERHENGGLVKTCDVKRMLDRLHSTCLDCANRIEKEMDEL